MNFIDLIICLVYLLVSVYIGCICGKKQTDTENYFLAGRTMKWWPIAISLFASLFSAISYIAMPGEAYNFGCTMLLAMLIPVIALPVSLFVFMRFFYNLKLWTVNEYLEKRFSVAIRCLSGVIFLVVRLVYLGVVLYATAILMESCMGWPPWLSILVVGVFSTLYTSFGGMEGVVWTDVMQFFVLFGGILAVIGFVAWCVPDASGSTAGLSGIWEYAAGHQRLFNVGPDSDFFTWSAKVRISIWPMLFGLPFALIGPAIDQINLQRCMSCKDFREVAWAVSANTLSQIPICFLFYFGGLAVLFYFGELRPLSPLPVGDAAFCRFISHELPVGIRGIVSAGVLAAVMSTMTSVLNSLSAVFVKDIYQRILRPGRDDRHYLRAAKLATLLTGVVSLGTGLGIELIFRGRNIPLLEVSNVCLTVCGAFGTAIFAMGLLTCRTSSRGMLAGVIAAVPVAFYLTVFRYLLQPPEQRIGFLFLSVFIIATCIAVSYLYSLLFGTANVEQRRLSVWEWHNAAENRRCSIPRGPDMAQHGRKPAKIEQFHKEQNE